MLARDAGILVANVEYRLAPTHQYPAAIDDCVEAWQWLLQSAGELGIDPARIAIAGQSAGGGLAAALALRVHDAGGVQPAAQILFCPMIDDRTALRSELDGNDYLMWNTRHNRQAWSWYLGQPAGAPEVPAYAAPARRDDLSGLPLEAQTGEELRRRGLLSAGRRREAARVPRHSPGQQFAQVGEVITVGVAPRPRIQIVRDLHKVRHAVAIRIHVLRCDRELIERVADD